MMVLVICKQIIKNEMILKKHLKVIINDKFEIND